MIPSASPATHPLAAPAVGPTMMKLYFSQYGSQILIMSSASRPPPRSAGCSQTISPCATFGSYVSGMNTQNFRFVRPGPVDLLQAGLRLLLLLVVLLGLLLLRLLLLGLALLRPRGSVPAGFGATRAFSCGRLLRELVGDRRRWTGRGPRPRSRSCRPCRLTSRVSAAPDR